MALVPSVCSHFFFERSSRHQDTTSASVTSEVRASLTTIMTHTQPCTMMASLENKVDEQVNKVPQQNGGNCRNEELQLEDVQDNNNESIEVEMVVPPDGGWGWMIVAASFMCNLFVDGIIFSFGVFLNDISEAFAVSKARVALVGSLQSGFYLMAGPFVSALANRYGFRLVAILGSVISCSAFVLSYFSTSIEFLYISYGVLGGIGAGLIYVPAVITTGFYFERWRALATGIAVCGSGIGAFMLAPISDILVKQFGWRGALLFQAGMLLNCAIFGAMFRPLKSTRIKVKSSPENAGLEVKSSLMARGVSTASLHCMQPERSGFFGTNNNTDYPTAAELLGSNPNIVNASKSLHSLHKIHAELRTLERKLSSSEKRLSVPIYPELDVNMDEKMVEEENNLLGGDVERLNGKVPTAYDQRQTTARGLGLQPEIAEDGQQAKPIQQGSAETVLQGRYLLRRFPEQTAALQIAAIVRWLSHVCHAFAYCDGRRRRGEWKLLHLSRERTSNLDDNARFESSQESIFLDPGYIRWTYDDGLLYTFYIEPNWQASRPRQLCFLSL
ncbi:uncharacterized protein LOC100647965 isoform X7 [Bombus terrestris]|uniref:Uncharacterized protein LOC100647965 isoform X7 n=1 Tax=Bombus terrestris TaxID=30195 RepID=A0A9C6S9M6_BOMTE|nr:uncharacterized protein LOC100647965 isoform X7 [Bombus terrestris]